MLKVTCAVVLLLAVMGCGGSHTTQTGGTPTPTPTPSGSTLTVCEVDPNNPNNCSNPAVISFGSTGQFKATASSGTTPTVNWSVNGVQGGSSATGTISASGLFTAPSPFDSGKHVTITATSQSDSTVTGSATGVIVNNDSSEPPPVLMGTSGGNATDSVKSGGTITCCSGTLGSLIQSGGKFFILSNNHVLNKSDFGMGGQNISQPGLIDSACQPGQTVATLTVAAALKPASCTTTPCTGPAPSNVDAAIAQVVALEVDTTGSILDLGAVNGAGINPLPPSSTPADAATVFANNEGVAKVGRSSGLTCSTLQAINVGPISVDYSSSCGGSKAFTATFTNQVVVNGGGFSAAGDSGSLIVTSDTARPVALLFAGNTTGTTANRIQDVLARPEFSQGSTPMIVGGADHAVSCSAVANSGITTISASTASLTQQERARVSAVQQRRAATLMQDPAIRSVKVGASHDNPAEGALVIRTTGTTQTPIPAIIDGVRTAIVSAEQEATGRLPVLSRDDIDHTSAIKEAHAMDLMSQPGIQGVGVGRSDDNPTETAIVIYVIQGENHPAIPATIDGVRTKIIEGDRFRAFGWGKEKNPVTKCAVGKK